VGGVDDVSRLAEEGDLKSQLARAGGTRSASSAAGAGGKSVQDRCKDLIKRCRFVYKLVSFVEGCG